MQDPDLNGKDPRIKEVKEMVNELIVEIAA